MLGISNYTPTLNTTSLLPPSEPLFTRNEQRADKPFVDKIIMNDFASLRIGVKSSASPDLQENFESLSQENNISNRNFGSSNNGLSTLTSPIAIPNTSNRNSSFSRAVSSRLHLRLVQDESSSSFGEDCAGVGIGVAQPNFGSSSVATLASPRINYLTIPNSPITRVHNPMIQDTSFSPSNRPFRSFHHVPPSRDSSNNLANSSGNPVTMNLEDKLLEKDNSMNSSFQVHDIKQQSKENQLFKTSEASISKTRPRSLSVGAKRTTKVGVVI